LFLTVTVTDIERPASLAGRCHSQRPCRLEFRERVVLGTPVTVDNCAVASVTSTRRELPYRNELSHLDRDDTSSNSATVSSA